MKYSEFKRWLKQQGAIFDPSKGKGSHQTVRLNGKKSVFPDHGAKEIPEGTRKAILKDLGLN